MEKKKDKMTMDKLAEMTQRGFKMLEDGLENKIDKLRKEMKGEIGGLKNRMDEMDGKFNRLLTGQDQVLKRLEDLEIDNTMDMAVQRRQEDKLENHEKRIVTVEEKLEVV